MRRTEHRNELAWPAVIWVGSETFPLAFHESIVQVVEHCAQRLAAHAHDRQRVTQHGWLSVTFAHQVTVRSLSLRGLRPWWRFWPPRLGLFVIFGLGILGVKDVSAGCAAL